MNKHSNANSNKTWSKEEVDLISKEMKNHVNIYEDADFKNKDIFKGKNDKEVKDIIDDRLKKLNLK